MQENCDLGGLCSRGSVTVHHFAGRPAFLPLEGKFLQTVQYPSGAGWTCLLCPSLVRMADIQSMAAHHDTREGAAVVKGGGFQWRVTCESAFPEELLKSSEHHLRVSYSPLLQKTLQSQHIYIYILFASCFLTSFLCFSWACSQRVSPETILFLSLPPHLTLQGQDCFSKRDLLLRPLMHRIPAS